MQAKDRVQLAGDDQLEEGELVGIRAKREDALVLSVLLEKLEFSLEIQRTGAVREVGHQSTKGGIYPLKQVSDLELDQVPVDECDLLGVRVDVEHESRRRTPPIGTIATVRDREHKRLFHGILHGLCSFVFW